MAKAKFSVKFEGFDDAVARIIQLGGNVNKITEEALEATHKHVTEQLPALMAKHKRTGRTEGTIVKTPKVEWSGTTASVKVGFDIKNGGLASIFLMYGTPRVKKDSKLYAAFYGAKTKREIVKIQEDLFYNSIGRLQ